MDSSEESANNSAKAKLASGDNYCNYTVSAKNSASCVTLEASPMVTVGVGNGNSMNLVTTTAAISYLVAISIVVPATNSTVTESANRHRHNNAAIPFYVSGIYMAEITTSFADLGLDFSIKSEKAVNCSGEDRNAISTTGLGGDLTVNVSNRNGSLIADIPVSVAIRLTCGTHSQKVVIGGQQRVHSEVSRPYESGICLAKKARSTTGADVGRIIISGIRPTTSKRSYRDVTYSAQLRVGPTV